MEVRNWKKNYKSTNRKESIGIPAMLAVLNWLFASINGNCVTKNRRQRNANAVKHLFLHANENLFNRLRGENDMKFDSLADLFEDDLIAREKKGEATGEAIGLVKGKAEERENGIEIFIKDKFEDDVPPEIIVAKLQKNYKLSEDDDKAYVKKYSPVATEK